jgi:hypothetical protein
MAFARDQSEAAVLESFNDGESSNLHTTLDSGYYSHASGGLGSPRLGAIDDIFDINRDFSPFLSTLDPFEPLQWPSSHTVPSSKQQPRNRSPREYHTESQVQRNLHAGFDNTSGLNAINPKLLLVRLLLVHSTLK